jgi:hypothetical protein
MMKLQEKDDPKDKEPENPPKDDDIFRDEDAEIGTFSETPLKPERWPQTGPPGIQKL